MNSKVLIILLFIFFSISCGKDLDNKTWAYFNETQCSNPWEHSNIIGTEFRVQEYLESNGIQVFDINIETVSYGPFCEACFCSSGRIIHVQILETDIEAIKTLGFNY